MFTPSLGLFDTLHHGRLATLPVNDVQRRMIFDFSTNGSTISFQEAWRPLHIKNISQFLDIPIWAVLLIMAITCIFHIFASTLIIKSRAGTNFNAKLVMEGFHSFIAPPLHFDWEYVYRRSSYKLTVLESWRRYDKSEVGHQDTTNSILRSAEMFLLHVLLFSLEHLICCIPLVGLKVSIYKVKLFSTLRALVTTQYEG